MASIKHLKWLIIPVFAILLMSHNASAFELTHDVRLIQGNHQSYVKYFTVPTLNTERLSCGTPYIYCVNDLADLNVDFAGFAATIPSRYYELGDYVTLDIYLFNNKSSDSLDAWVRNLRLYSSHWDLVDVRFESISNSSGVIHITTRCYSPVSDDFLTIQASSDASYSFKLYPGEGFAMGVATVWRPIYDTDYTDKIDDVIDAINNQQSAPSAQDIADAVNEPEEQATENISNQSADDYEMESANMSSLFSQFGNFISAVNGASVGDCNIPADFNHIDLGILNLCANPVPDYVQVAVSIVSCMLIAPYLMNIIKRILSIADKIREV